MIFESMTIDEAKIEIESVMNKWYWNILSTTDAVKEIIEVANGERTTEDRRSVSVARN